MAVIELLRTRVPVEKQEEFLARDAAVWTPALANHDGFISKECWISLDEPDLVTMVIHWNSLAQWQSFPADLLTELDRQMGDLLFPLTCETYAVHGQVPH